ncbi:peptidoglycan-binding domain-containing protein [Ralstonia insidiosa]|uniref:Peptidoglycan-binding protein n=1 Tax=Ralstonia insidiosa TaxID=190721 RepID=A0A848P3R0_9RALS|nr:peptidoglycan-binding domain-containing protein [Ralstonia insidiosa]NMV39843.1 peptidoglycan-binding protein [Ralstonia insidiosa]
MIKFVAKSMLLAIAASTISACAPIISGVMNASLDEDALKAKTGAYLGVPAGSVMISSMEKGAVSTTYKARYGDKRYGCSTSYGQVECKQLPPGAASDQSSTSVDPQADQKSGMSYVQAQTRLNQLGFSVGAPDGVFGKKSVQQLRLFQKSRGLAETGRLDASTIDALR